MVSGMKISMKFLLFGTHPVLRHNDLCVLPAVSNVVVAYVLGVIKFVGKVFRVCCSMLQMGLLDVVLHPVLYPLPAPLVFIGLRYPT